MEALENMDNDEFLEREFAMVLEERMAIEKAEQEQFISSAKNQLQEDTVQELKATSELSRLVDRKTTTTTTDAFGFLKYKSKLL